MINFFFEHAHARVSLGGIEFRASTAPWRAARELSKQHRRDTAQRLLWSYYMTCFVTAAALKSSYIEFGGMRMARVYPSFKCLCYLCLFDGNMIFLSDLIE